MATILLVDHAWRGHRLAYAKHAAEALSASGHSVTLGLPAEAWNSESIRAWFGEGVSPAIATTILPQKGGGRLRSMWAWTHSVQAIARSTQTDLVVHLWADRLVTPWLAGAISCRATTPPLIALMGRMPPNCRRWGTPREKLIRRFRRAILFVGIALGSFSRIGILCGSTEDCAPLNPSRLFPFNALFYVRDPVVECCQQSQSTTTCKHHSKTKRITALVAGDLSARKHVPQLIRLFRSASTGCNIHLRLVGAVDQSARTAIDGAELEDLIKSGASSVDLRYLNQQELCAEIKRCDVLLLGFEAQWTSSGMFGLAVSHGKPVVVWGNEYVARLVQSSRSGVVLPGAPKDFESLQAAIQSAIDIDTRPGSVARQHEFNCAIFGDELAVDSRGNRMF